jgi:hypothetical protein
VIAGHSKRKRTVAFFLVLGYLCVLALIVNLVAHVGWIHVRIPGLVGFVARWRLAVAAAVCFVCAWYVERLGRAAR